MCEYGTAWLPIKFILSFDEETGPSINAASNKVTCPNLYVLIENLKM